MVFWTGITSLLGQGLGLEPGFSTDVITDLELTKFDLKKKRMLTKENGCSDHKNKGLDPKKQGKMIATL